MQPTEPPRKVGLIIIRSSTHPSTHPNDRPYQYAQKHTLSTHPIDQPYRLTLSTDPIKTLSTLLQHPPSQHSSSYPLDLLLLDTHTLMTALKGCEVAISVLQGVMRSGRGVGLTSSSGAATVKKMMDAEGT